MTFDGMTMTEVAACVMHISDLYPAAQLAPAPGTPERAQWYRWLAFLTNTVQVSFINYFRRERAVAEEFTEALETKAVEVLAGLRDQIEEQLAASGPYLLGERFSSADPLPRDAHALGPQPRPEVVGRVAPRCPLASRPSAPGAAARVRPGSSRRLRAAR